jgi:hypothetical protein
LQNSLYVFDRGHRYFKLVPCRAVAGEWCQFVITHFCVTYRYIKNPIIFMTQCYCFS